MRSSFQRIVVQNYPISIITKVICCIYDVDKPKSSKADVKTEKCAYFPYFVYNLV